MDFNNFKQRWLGQRVDRDGVYQYQCVDLVVQYLFEGWGEPSAYGNAIDFWTRPADSVTRHFDRVESSDARAGDILVFRTRGRTDYSGDGHIGIATGGLNATTVEVLEQNGNGTGTGQGGDAVRTRWIDRSRVAGILRPKPQAPPAPTQRWKVIENYDGGKQVKLNKQPTHLWGMNFEYNHMVANPVEIHNAGEIWTVRNKVYHESGGFYYRRDGQVDGFNVVDCDDYTPEPPAPIVKQWPAAPVTASSTEQYEVIKLIDGWETSNRATNRLGLPKLPVGAGMYYVFNKRYSDNDPNLLLAVNVTNKLGQPGAWIRVADNVPDPIPEPPKPEPIPVKIPAPISEWPNGNPRSEPAIPPVPTPTPEPVEVKPEPKEVKRPDWRSTYNSFRNEFGEVKPRKYVAYSDYTVKDLATQGKDVLLRNNDFIYIAGTFIGEDDNLYGRPQDAVIDQKTGIPRYMWYGVLMDKKIIRPYAETFNTTTTIKERQALHTIRPIDYISITLKETEGFIGKFWDIITSVANRKTNIKK